MGFIRAVGLGASLAAFALTLSAVSQPAEAGKACDKLRLTSPCISDSDLNPSSKFGGSGDHGRLQILNAAERTAVELRGSTANVTNLFSNRASKSNGLVKAWARINANGTIESCWRCNKNPNLTLRVNDGFYLVDFTPLSTNIRRRPMTATSAGFGSNNYYTVTLITHNDFDASSVIISTINFVNLQFTDSRFVLMIY